MSGIIFVGPGRETAESTFDDLRVALAAPLLYTGDNELSQHLWRAMWHPEAELSARQHVNESTGREFECSSYYADDPYVMAQCAMHGDRYLATLGIQFVRKLVKVCHQLVPALDIRPRSPSRSTLEDAPGLARDPALASLIEDETDVSESEALAIVATWPSATAEGAQIELGAFTLFYDLIRLVWLHEWAHALCGHVAFASARLGIALNEFSADRVGEDQFGGLQHSRFEVFQALEIHADEFATDYLVPQILTGHDPAGVIAGPTVDLVDRLLIFNVACAVFAVIWSRAERRLVPGMTWVPPRPPLTSEEPEPLFQPFKTSHPPAVLRYLRFRNFLQLHATDYNRRSHSLFSAKVDALSSLFVDRLGEMYPDFYSLSATTPGPARTPGVKRLNAYEDYLVEVGDSLTSSLVELGYVPTRDPWAEDG